MAPKFYSNIFAPSPADKHIPFRDGYNTRKGKVVRTFLPSSKIIKNIYDATIPYRPKTIGDFLRKERLERRLLQRDVAELLGVSENGITGWENNRYQPQVQYYPAIIKFIGYYPFTEQLQTIGGQLLMTRQLFGITAKAMGDKIGVCGYTILAWENNKYRIKPVYLKRYYELGLPEQQSLSN